MLLKFIRSLLLGMLLSVTVALATAAGEGRDKSPFDFSWVTYLWVIVWAVAGGMVSFYRKMKEGHVRAFNFTEFIGELVTSGFAGLLTFWLCEAAEINKLLAAVFIGISGHMGSRVIFLLEKYTGERLEKFTEAKP